MECGHLDRVCKNGFQASNFPVLTDPTTKLECGECGDTTSVWLCVSCGALNCGRYIKAHGLMHKEKNKGHSVCMDTSQLTVYCYDCDEFVVNDTQDRFLENLRTLVLTKKLTLEAQNETPGRSLRARRKRDLDPIKPVVPAKKHKASKKENKEKTVVKSSQRKRVGLRNLGNTCFMNSVLQSLSNIEEFCNALTKLPSLEDHMKRNKDIKKSVERVISDGVIVTEELKKVIMALKQCDEKGAYISTESLLKAIWKVVPRFRGYQQQDAHEFLRYMLDRLHTELLHLLPCMDHKMRMLRSQSNSVVTAVFGGTLQSSVTCLTCHQSSKTDDPFLDLSIDIPPAFSGPVRKTKDAEGPVCSIHDCLQKFVETEELDDSERFYCKSCKSKQPSTKQFCIRRLPTVLCLHIKRFRWSNHARTKVDTFVEFPLSGLDMSNYLLRNLSSTRFSNANSCLYDLAAAIVHHGNGMGSGHYTAFATNSQAWFNFNDCSVKETDFQTVQSSRAYILFYVQRDFNRSLMT